MRLGSKLSRQLAYCLAALMVWLSAPPPAAAKSPSEMRAKAKAQKDAGRNAEGGEEATGEKGPTAFAEALERGKTALEQMEGAAQGIPFAEEQKDAAEAAKLRKDKADYQASATRLFRQALALAGNATGKDRPEAKDVNLVRYYLCFLHYGRAEYYESAVMGEFLARNSPAEALEGRQGARIALASLLQIFNEAKEPEQERTFEIAHIHQIAELIAKQWPGGDEMQEAAVRLLNLSIKLHQMDKAIGYLPQIPEKSPLRVNSEIQLGQALWATYLKATQLPPEQRPPAAELQRYKTGAEKCLTDAIAQSRDTSDPSPTLAAAMYSLAQIYLEAADNEKAIATLEDKQFGPITLLKAKDPAVGREGFAIETFKVALRAYVATGDTKNAAKVMKALEKRLDNAGNTKAGDNLTAIYIMLGHELQQQIARLEQNGQRKELDAVSAAFENFLNKIQERGGGNSFGSVSWVAENFYALATRQDDGAPEPPAKIKGYYASAAQGYEQILARAEKEPSFVPDPEKLIGIRLRMAICERRTGNFKTAIKLISKVLQDRPQMITAQVQGAETYQLSGFVDKRGYLDAVAGGEPTPRGNNVIWGWGKLAKKTQNDERFEDTFFQARLKISECWYQFGLKAVEKEQKDKYLDMAKKDLRLLYQLYPKLGGADSYAKYDHLTKQIQEELGEKPIGIQEFKDADGQSAQVEK